MRGYFDELQYKVNLYRTRFPNDPRRAAWHMMIWAAKSIWGADRRITRYCANTPQPQVLFKLSGGIGDIIIAINHLMQLQKHTDAVFNISVAPHRFNDVRTILAGTGWDARLKASAQESKFDMVVDLFRVPVIEHINPRRIKPDSFMGKWAAAVIEFNRRHFECLAGATPDDCLLERITLLNGRHRMTQADTASVVGNVADELKIQPHAPNQTLKKFGLVDKKYITVQRGAGVGTQKHGGFVTRDWPVENYNSLIEMLRCNFPDYIFVQIGNDEDARISTTDINLCGKTTLDEILGILSGATLHLGGEAGPVHLRHFMHAGPCAVFFGPTNIDFFGYPENINICARICPGCEWAHRDWGRVCIKNQSMRAACMEAITPDMAVERISEVLK